MTKDRIETVVQYLARAVCRDFDGRIPLARNLADDFVEVEVGVNVLLDDLANMEAQRQQHLAMLEQKNKELEERQMKTLRELSTPVISVWEGVLALPVIGMVDTERATNMMEELLQRVVQEQATHVVIDITGVSVVDTRTADHILRTSEAVRLLGAECFLTGISPAIAQTMAQLGIDTARIRSMRRLSDALEQVFAQVGMSPRRGA